MRNQTLLQFILQQIDALKNLFWLQYHKQQLILEPILAKCKRIITLRVTGSETTIFMRMVLFIWLYIYELRSMKLVSSYRKNAE